MITLVYWLWKKNPFVFCLLLIDYFYFVERIFLEIYKFPNIWQYISLE